MRSSCWRLSTRPRTPKVRARALRPLHEAACMLACKLCALTCPDLRHMHTMNFLLSRPVRAQEAEQVVVCDAVEFIDTPDFFGPGGLRGARAPGAAPCGTFAERAAMLTPPALQLAAADASFATT